MSRRTLLVWCSFFIFSLGCRAQVESRASVSSNAQLDTSSGTRQLEVLIRSQFSIPPDYDIVFGVQSKSETADFNTLPVTFVHQGKQETINLLISKDGNTLARLEKFDLRKNPALSIDVIDRPVRGNPDAKVQIINFDDLECPYCAQLNSEILPETLDRYKGLIKIVYKDSPIEGHPWAIRAAVDASCLASLNPAAYWAYIDYVHNHREEINGTQMDLGKSFQALDNIASKIGSQNKAGEAELAMCLKNQNQSAVSASLNLVKTLGLRGMPQMFVDGERLPEGARPTSELWPAIDRALRAQGIAPPTPTANTTTTEQTTR